MSNVPDTVRDSVSGTASSSPQLTAWGSDLQPAACPRCQASFLVPCGAPPPRCPACCQAKLDLVPGGMQYLAHPYSPELVAPFSLTEAQIGESARKFAASVPFAPRALDGPGLRARLQPLYLPMWLVDGCVSGYWQVEAGFDYEVISHQETYAQNRQGWETRQVKEQRTRWENRVGRINRGYQNVTAPALEDAPRLEKQLGRFALDSAQSFSPERIQHSCVRLPDRPPKAAWGEAAAAFQKTAAAECQKACGANRLRQFRWKASFSRLNWTLMLLPVYTTCYPDDDGTLQPVLIHGQTGEVTGARRASLRRARGASLVILALGLLLVLAGLLLDLTASVSVALGTASAFMVVIGIITMLAAGAPVMVAWDFNRRQRLEEVEVRRET